MTKIQIVPRGTICNFITYYELLKKWNPKINLVAKSTLDDFWNRHLLDSLQLCKYVENASDKILIDLGSGAGFPGMVLAMMGFLEVHLIESDQRKCAFLNEVVRETKTKAEVHSQRIENNLSKGNIVTARALSPLNELLAMSEDKLLPGGECLFLKGEQWQQEIEQAKKDFSFDCTAHESVTDKNSRVLQIKNIKKV
ncbi:MAG: 16S rRNA (guanine(527)-N(7))-methyltransferase RsmG [Alphaproteobacteria bacterium]|nr:MAG: 16S rRNA (guanine(527)-N(7))-methyltransferase RsmG [Alphaproteobacteria bacterium]